MGRCCDDYYEVTPQTVNLWTPSVYVDVTDVTAAWKTSVYLVCVLRSLHLSLEVISYFCCELFCGETSVMLGQPVRSVPVSFGTIHRNCTSRSATILLVRYITVDHHVIPWVDPLFVLALLARTSSVFSATGHKSCEGIVERLARRLAFGLRLYPV